MARQTTRREFVQQTTAASAAWWAATSTGYTQERAKIEQINFACIGVGGKGSSDSDSAGKHGNVVAICDVDENSLRKKAARFKNAKTFNDYREMLDTMGDKIDAVTVSTPDHSHAPAAAMAMRMGKAAFCQKPLTWSVKEARTLRELAAEKGVATQMGNQGTSESGLREAVEVIRSGAIGDVTELHIWTNRPIWPQGTGRPAGSQPVPSHVHWDLFLGPAQERPYHSAYHPFKWRGWLDFGTGALGDMACHTANMAVMALELFDPKTIEADSSGIVENETFPKWSEIKFEFGARGNLPPCSLTWYDGGKKPPAALLQGEKQASSGSLLVGTKGSLYSPNDYGAAYVLLPRKQYMDYKKPDPSIPRSPGHFTEYANAIKGGPAAMSNFGYAGRLTETILLGNAALRAGEKLEWDATKMEFTNAPSANQYLHREYREGWTL